MPNRPSFQSSSSSRSFSPPPAQRSAPTPSFQAPRQEPARQAPARQEPSRQEPARSPFGDNFGRAPSAPAPHQEEQHHEDMTRTAPAWNPQPRPETHQETHPETHQEAHPAAPHVETPHTEAPRSETPRTETPRQEQGRGAATRTPTVPFQATPGRAAGTSTFDRPAPPSDRRDPSRMSGGLTQPRSSFGEPTGPVVKAPQTRVNPNNPNSFTREATQHNQDGGLSHVYTTDRTDGSKRIKTDTVGPNGQKSVRITTVDTHGQEVTARTRGVDSWSSRVPVQHYNQAVNQLSHGGEGYHRDVTYSTRVTNRTTIIINNNTYIAPHYYHEHSSLGAFASGFFAGYVAGAIDQSLLDNYSEGFNRCGLYQPYLFPETLWQPYYRQVLFAPLPPVYVQPVYVDYSTPTAWSTPPLDPTRDPLEQLAQFGSLQKPGFFGNTTIGAIEARNRLNQGQPITVGGVEVDSYQQLSAIVPEMAQGQGAGASFSPDQRQVLQSTIQPPQQAPSVDDTIANLPTFQQVYSPKALVAEDQVDGKNINRTMDAAAAVYDRPEVKQAIATWWQANPTADRSALNEEVNFVVTSALQNDLQANGAAYAATPDLEDNPVSYLQDPSTNPGAVAYNQQAISAVAANAAQQLRTNLICTENS